MISCTVLFVFNKYICIQPLDKSKQISSIRDTRDFLRDTQVNYNTKVYIF